MPSTFSVQSGFWVNFDYGWVNGATITLKETESQILASFFGVFLTFVGVQLWHTIAFVIHQARATNNPVDGLHRQQQLVWRNTKGPAASAWVFGKQLYAWRKHADGVIKRTLPLLVIGIIYAVAFAVLSIFASSEITKATGDARVVEPGRCGYFNITSPRSNIDQAALDLKNTRDFAAARSYANSCYPTSRNQTIARCDIYKKPYIHYTTNFADSCPWPGFCTGFDETVKPIVMDTGLTDSHEDWGINSRSSLRLQYRRVTTCSPISVRNFTDVQNVTDIFGIQEHRFVYLGSTTGLKAGDVYNYTFNYNRVSEITSDSYGLDTESWSPDDNNTDLTWYPIPELKRTDGDLTVMFITANAVTNNIPISDAIYQADLEIENYYEPSIGYNYTLYEASSDIGVMACMDQFEYCNPVNGKCTGLGTSFASFQKVYDAEMGSNDAQDAIALRLLAPGASATISNTANYGGSAALKASETVSFGSQSGKPTWQAEALHWFETAMARMQQEVLEFATGPLNTDNLSPITLPDDSTHRSMCNAQMTMYKDGSASYSVLGLALVIGLGSIIILISLTLDIVVGFIQRTFHAGEHRRTAWILDSSFQLHRQVCEGLGFGGRWENLEDEVPVCTRGARFGGDGQATLSELKTPDLGAGEGLPFIAGQNNGYFGGEQRYSDGFTVQQTSYQAKTPTYESVMEHV